jgi:hypothetical protein
MSETAKDIGLLVGDEPAISQTQIAAREAEQQRIAAAADAAPGLEDGAELPSMEKEEEEDTEATDEEPTSADVGDVPGGLGRVPGLCGDDIRDADVLDVEAPAVEEDEVDEGYEDVAAAQQQTSRRGGAASADLGDVPGALGRMPGLGGDDILDADVLDVEAPAVEEDEVDAGCVLEDEELEKEEEEDEGFGPLGAGTRIYNPLV